MTYMREKYHLLKYVDNSVDKNIFFFRDLVYWWYFILKFKVKRKTDKIKNITECFQPILIFLLIIFLLFQVINAFYFTILWPHCKPAYILQCKDNQYTHIHIHIQICIGLLCSFLMCKSLIFKNIHRRSHVFYIGTHTLTKHVL